MAFPQRQPIAPPYSTSISFTGLASAQGPFNTPFPTPINTPPCPANPALTNTDYRDLDPRVSLAWAPAAMNGDTVIRAGFGIYHGAAQNDDLNAGLESDTFRCHDQSEHPADTGLRAGNSRSVGLSAAQLKRPTILAVCSVKTAAISTLRNGV